MGRKVACFMQPALQGPRRIWVVALLLALPLGLQSQAAPSQGDALLRQWWGKVGPCRPLTARLSGQPFFPKASGSCWQGKSSDQLLEIVRLEAAFRESNEPQASSALATAAAAKGRIQEAIEVLEAASDKSSAFSARLLSDLSALYLQRAIEGDSMRDYWRALSSAERAVGADKTQLEAAFNLALTLDSLHLYRSALEAWKAYQELDPDSPWSKEAQQRIDWLSYLHLGLISLSSQIGEALKADDLRGSSGHRA